MEITSLKLLNFRNFDKLELCFSEKRNIIIGNNGEGKTNIIESIFVLALTKSFRTNFDEFLIKSGKTFFKVEAVVKSSFINNFKLIYQDKAKIVKINNKKISKLSDYISNMNVILYSINDIKLIKDTPSTKRKLINLEISQFDNVYVQNLNYYNKILKQRNNYIKTVNEFSVNHNYINVITSQLIEYGKKIYEIREKFVNSINEYLTKIYNILGIEGNLNIMYKSEYSDLNFEELLNLYNKTLIKDINFKSTQLGIHHDDFIFMLNGNEIKDYGSEGQQKCAVIAFKLAEIQLFYKIYQDYPILMLDDLFSELDVNRIEKILNYIDENIQTFITTTDLKKIKKKYLKNSKIFHLSNNKLEEELL